MDPRDVVADRLLIEEQGGVGDQNADVLAHSTPPPPAVSSEASRGGQAETTVPAWESS
jgi:hypothetical protein